MDLSLAILLVELRKIHSTNMPSTEFCVQGTNSCQRLYGVVVGSIRGVVEMESVIASCDPDAAHWKRCPLRRRG